MRVWVDGQWQRVDVLGIGEGGHLRPVTIVGDTEIPAGMVEVTLTVSSAVTPFTPWVTVHSGGAVEWLSPTGITLSTALQPSLTGHTTYRLRSTPDAVRYLNLGFDHTDDAGRDGPGVGQDWPATTITGITGLGGLASLEAVMAAHTSLTGHLDLTGLGALLFVECFEAAVTSITLTGCDSLIRLCLEANGLSTLDLNPVRGTLEDLRAAIQTSPALDFAPLTGPIPHLWHWCVRDQPVTRMPQHAQLPAVEQHWAWNCSQTTSDSPVSAGLNSYLSDGNSYDTASVDRILTALAAITTGGGTVNLAGSATPSATGLAAAATLTGRGWTVTHS